MSDIKKEFVDEVNGTLGDRIDEQGTRPRVEVWPADDEYARWVAFHETKDRAVICATPEFKDTPFCGTGHH